MQLRPTMPAISECDGNENENENESERTKKDSDLLEVGAARPDVTSVKKSCRRCSAVK
jgi:hypothetical protein